MNFRSTIASLLLIAGTSVVTANDIPSVAVAAGSFETLVAALGAADLVNALAEPNGPYTVFAPTDDAFGGLPDGLVGCLLLEENKPVLTDILLYHVAAGKTLSTDLADGMAIPTLLLGSDYTIAVSLPNDGRVLLNDSTMVVTPNVEATNGIIHVVDQVLVPPGIDVAAFLNACQGEDETKEALPDIPSTAVAAGFFETLVAALTATDLVGALSAPNGPYTVFAPTDEAFDNLPDGILNCLLDNPSSLSDVLLYHVASGTALSTDLSNGMKVPTLLEGADVTVHINGNGVSVNDATVSVPDVLTSNGVIHVIDEVLVPQRLDLGDLCSPPEKETGGSMTGGKVVCSYLGVGRAAGEYLTGPTHTCLCTASGHWTNCRPNHNDVKTIEGLVVESSQLSTLEAAIQKAGILGVLNGRGPFTLFAPTDRAFAKVPSKLLDFLLADGNESVLAQVLQYHVYAGRVRSSSIDSGTSEVPTLLGGSDTIAVEKSCLSAFDTCDDTYSVLLNGNSYVVEADVDTSNGIIHAIDEVLIPPSLASAVEGILAA
mmetsp:Transcript_4771/g.12256  ORF Transcript_4771/g.12256 Transcript_4771/m.12256 type:complete len:544 (-) Transcript_4771:205-1836(-)